MRVSRYTDYALRILIYLGQQDGRLCSIAEIAEVYAISENHLMKVVQDLAHEGIVQTVRGRGGGIRLAKRPEAIRIGDVVRHTETDCELVDCTGCRLATYCKLRNVLSESQRAFFAVIDSYTLADLL